MSAPALPELSRLSLANTEALAGRRGTGLLGLMILFGVLTTMLAVAVILVIVSVPIGPSWPT